MTPATLVAARRYTAQGWAVFPLGPRKQPLALCPACRTDCPGRDACRCPVDTCHGLYAATRDPQRGAAWWTAHPEWGIGIRTGAVSGLVALDIDDHAGGAASLAQLETRHGLLPGTVGQHSGSGTSIHLLYAHPGGTVRNSAGRLGPGLDVRGDGGYIVAAPTVHPKTGRPYFWHGDTIAPLAPWPALLTELLEPERPRPAPAPGVTRPQGVRRGRLLGVLTVMLEAKPGERNGVLYWCAARLAEMHHGGDLTDLNAAVGALHDAAVSAGLAPAEVGDEHRGTIASGLRSIRTGAAA